MQLLPNNSFKPTLLRGPAYVLASSTTPGLYAARLNSGVRCSGRIMDTFLTSGIVGAVAGGLAVLAFAFLVPRKSCPKCKTLLPRFRKPATGREAMLGGWHCQKCGARIARNGSLLPNDA